MGSKLLEAWNGGKKAFFSALFGAIIGTLSTAMTIGAYKEKVDTLEKNFEHHMNVYTPNISGDYQLTKTKVAVLDTQMEGLQKSMDEIKEQNKTIIALMRKR